MSAMSEFEGRGGTHAARADDDDIVSAVCHNKATYRDPCKFQSLEL
jgi:hypothetical protein